MTERAYIRKRKGRNVNNTSDVWSDSFKLKLEEMAERAIIEQLENKKIELLMGKINFAESVSHDDRVLFCKSLLLKIEQTILKEQKPIYFIPDDRWGKQTLLRSDFIRYSYELKSIK